MSSADVDDYLVEPAESADDIAACMAVLERIRRDELNRAGASVVESDVFDGVETDYVLLGCRDLRSGQIAGCIRLTVASDLSDISSVRREYRFDSIPSDLLASSLVLTRLAILSDHRHTVAGLRLYEGLYRYSLRHEIDLYLLSCEPNLVPLYQSLGGRPYGRIHRGSRGGLRVPMVFIPHDVAHFKSSGSPIAAVYDELGPQLRPAGLAWFDALVEDEGGIDAGIQPYRGQGAEAHWLLTRGLTESGVEELLTNCLVVRPALGDTIIAVHDGGSSAGFVVRGMLEIRAAGQVVALLGPGEVFGEMAPVLGERRTASVIAATDDDEVAVLSQKAFERVSDSSDREQLWRNLAWILARKLVAASGDSLA